MPGSGFTAWDLERIEIGVDAVRSENWKRENPFGYSLSETVGDMAKSVLLNPKAAEEIYTRVKSRGIQQLVFRAALLRAYRACAICGLTIPECLQAAHIVPYSQATAEQRISPRNGLLLCANHHLMFDRHQIAISPDGIVRYRSPDRGDANIGQDHAATTGLNGRPAFLPRNKNSQPEISTLEIHYEIFAAKLARRKRQ